MIEGDLCYVCGDGVMHLFSNGKQDVQSRERERKFK